MAGNTPKNLLVHPKQVIANPTSSELREMVAAMPNATKTEFGNYAVKIKVKARSKKSTFIVTDSPEQHTDQCMSPEKAEEMAQLQNEYIKDQTMLVIDGFIGGDPATRTACRLTIEKTNANIAAMQQQLYFTPTAEELETFEPELNIIYTPNLAAEGFPDDRLISVDLDNKITRVFNSDYFGESKKAGLRMWNKLVYDKGGLPLHAGCKVIPVGDEKRTALIIGLSGTGKTTTTFTKQNSSQPVQDDFVALMPDGSVLGTENGCFAKTFGLNAENEPMIHNAVVQPEAYLENVSVDENGKVDFYDKSFTENGRATFPFRLIPDAADPKTLPPVSFVLILNRNENIIPAVARLTKEQAAAYFMLGETKGTSAGGAEEAGKALRVPGTNPFFPLLHGQQGNRFLELGEKLPFEVYLMNTGWVGGVDGTEFSKKVKIRHSSAVVQGIAEQAISWKKCATFGYEVATKLTGMNNGDHNLLNPEGYYQSTERSGEYQAIATNLMEDRKNHLQQFPGLNPVLIEAIS